MIYQLKKMPAKWILVSDVCSLLMNVKLFQLMLSNWSLENFALWEWLQIWLGLCLLIPRNGIDIVAQRAAVKHPRRLQEWGAILLAIRVPCSVISIIFFILTSYFIILPELRILVPLSMTLICSASAPDLACRVQYRLKTVALIQFAKSCIVFCLMAGICYMNGSQVQAAWGLLLTEFILMLFWWFDCWQVGAMPGGRWCRFLLLARRPILFRSMMQSAVRFFRVASWNADAILVGAIAPNYWRVIAPVRRILMTFVIPLSNWLGAVGPLLAGRKRNSIQARFRAINTAAVSIAGLSAVISFYLGPYLWRLFLGQNYVPGNSLMALMMVRLAPMTILVSYTAMFTALGRDFRSAVVALSQLFAACLGGLSCVVVSSEVSLCSGILICESTVACFVFLNSRFYEMKKIGFPDSGMMIIKPHFAVANQIQIKFRNWGSKKNHVLIGRKTGKSE